MKKLILAAMLSAAYTAGAQELAYKIPKDATAVASLKGNKLLELISIPEFNQSYLAKKMLAEASHKDGGGKYVSVEDFGVKLNGTVYYYLKQTDSVSYHCILIPLADAGKFEQKFRASKRERITRVGDVRKMIVDRDEAQLLFNNEFAYFTFVKLNTHFLETDSAASARYGLKSVSYSDYYYNQAPVALEPGATEAVDDVASPYYGQDMVVDTVAAVEDIETIKSVELVDPPAIAEEEENRPQLERLAQEPEVDIAREVETEAVQAPMVAEPPPPEPAENFGMNSNYNLAYEQQRKIKNELSATWMDAFSSAMFVKNDISNSILENPEYKRVTDNDAVATLYMNSFGDLYRDLMPYYTRKYMSNFMAGYGSMNAKLYLDKDQARMSTEMAVDDRQANAFRKMYWHKPNKQFAKYINSDRMVAFMSYSINTEEYLKEMPEMLGQAYGRYFGVYRDEIGMSAEILSLLLDEKAIGKVVKGDAVLLLSDVGPKEYSYMTYDYDDDYKRSQVTKTKTETLPDFLFMMSSDDTRIIERLLNYGIHKKVMTLKNGIYTLDNKVARRNPFSVHVLIKDGIVFCGTSLRDIQQISNGSFQQNISKEDKELLLKNNFAVSFNPKNLVGKISQKEFGSTRKLTAFNNLLGSTGRMYMKSTVIKNNIISAEMVADVPEHQENAMKYFLSLVEQAAKID